MIVCRRAFSKKCSIFSELMTSRNCVLTMHRLNTLNIWHVVISVEFKVGDVKVRSASGWSGKGEGGTGRGPVDRGQAGSRSDRRNLAARRPPSVIYRKC